MERQFSTEKSSERQREMAFGLLELMRETPYEKISVGELCDHVNVSRKTFYRHFSCKHDTLEMLIDLAVLDMGVYTPPVVLDPKQPYLGEMIRYFYYWSEHRQILEILLQNSLMEIFFFRTVSIALSEMQFFEKQLEQQGRCAQETTVGFYVGGLVSMLIFWLKNGFRDTPEQMASRLLDLIGASNKRE